MLCLLEISKTIANHYRGVEIHHGKLDEIKKRTNKFFDTSSMKFNQVIHKFF